MLPSIPPDTMSPCLGLVSMEKMEPSCANSLLIILSFSHRYNCKNILKYVESTYKAIITTGYNCIFKETHWEEWYVDVFKFFLAFHHFPKTWIYLLTDQCQSEASLILNLMTEHATTHISESLYK